MKWRTDRNDATDRGSVNFLVNIGGAGHGGGMVAKVYEITKPRRMWQVAYPDPFKRDGKGRARMVRRHFADEAAALKHQAEVNKRVTIEGTAGLAFDATVRADAIAARQVLEAAGHAKMTLRQLADAYVQRVPRSAAGSMLVGEALELFLKEKRLAEGRTPQTVMNLSIRVSRWIREAKITQVHEVTRESVEHLRTRAVSAQARRNDINAVSSFCTWLLEQRKIDHHPLMGLRRPHVEWKPPTVFTTAECGRLLRAAQAMEHDDALGPIVVLLYVGVRPSEVEGTRLFYGRSPMARIEGGKLRGRANRTVPLLPAAVAWLKAAGSPERVTPLNKHARGRLMAEAGLSWGVDTCRHTCISNLAELLNNDAKVARQAGTSEAMIARHYRRLRTPQEARAWAALRPGKG